MYALSAENLQTKLQSSYEKECGLFNAKYIGKMQ